MKYTVTVEGTDDPILILDLLHTSIELVKEINKYAPSRIVNGSCTIRKDVDLTFKTIENEDS